VSAGLAAGQCSMLISTICLQVLLYVVILLSINATHAPKKHELHLFSRKSLLSAKRGVLLTLVLLYANFNKNVANFYLMFELTIAGGIGYNGYSQPASVTFGGHLHYYSSFLW
jgi:hypothetical protein